VGGYAYHVLNRANGRLRLFRKEADFAAFDALVGEARSACRYGVVGYTIMGNHGHFGIKKE
jgi:putative transposase